MSVGGKKRTGFALLSPGEAVGNSPQRRRSDAHFVHVRDWPCRWVGRREDDSWPIPARVEAGNRAGRKGGKMGGRKRENIRMKIADWNDVIAALRGALSLLSVCEINGDAFGGEDDPEYIKNKAIWDADIAKFKASLERAESA